MCADLRNWFWRRKDEHIAYYMAFHRGTARGILRILRKLDNLRRRVLFTDWRKSEGLDAV